MTPPALAHLSATLPSCRRRRALPAAARNSLDPRALGTPPPPPRPRHAGTLDFEYALARPQMGYCAPTLEPGDCARGVKGGWNATALGIADLAGCVARCRGCARCRYVSFSPLHEDCSWFHTCEMADLRMRWAGYTYETAAVSPKAPRAPE